MDPIKRNFLVFILKVIIYVCTLALSFLGASSLTSCSVHRGILDVKVTQRGWIIINDTLRLSAVPFCAPTTNDWRGKGGLGGLGPYAPHNHGTMLNDVCYEIR